MSSPDFLEGCVPAGEFATSLKKTYRTIHRWMSEPDGLPYLKLGRDRYIHIETARQWLFSRRTRRRNSPRPSRAKAPPTPITRRLATDEAAIRRNAERCPEGRRLHFSGRQICGRVRR